MVSDFQSNLIILLIIVIVIIFVYNKNINNGSIESEHFDSNDSCDNTDIKSVKKRHRSKKNKKHWMQTMDMSDALNILGRSQKKSINNSNLSDLSSVGSSDSYSVMVDVNQEFTEMQYHNDYNDTITAINGLTPQKELFNMGFLPVKEVVPDRKNIKDLVKLFMKKLNNEITNNVQEFLHVNSGWNDMGKRRREKSGFEIQMEELGLPGSLYNEPASKAPANLIRIDKSEQFNTENQIRFVAYIIIQKPNVQDQMVLKVQFFLEREDLKSGGDDRANFFNKKVDQDDDRDIKIDSNQIVIIEQVFILGYLTNQTKNKTKMDKFHDYTGIQRSDGTIDQEKVVKMMLKKHKERADELNSFTNTLSPENQELRDINDGDNVLYNNTRTIMDDLARYPPEFI
jgi:uncharacterized protein (UPF0333 family)